MAHGASGSANLAAVLEAAAAGGGWAARPAFVVGGRTFTHAEVHDGAARAATLLAELGVGRGDRVLLALPDGIGFAWTFLGTARLGAVALPVNPRLTADDHRMMVDDARPTVVVACAELVARFSSGAAVVDEDGLEEAMRERPPHPPVAVHPEDPAYAQYTSGTTGAPKAALHRHRDPLVYVDAFARPGLGVAADDVLLSVSKMFFAYGLGNSLFFTLASGCRAVLHPGPPKVDLVVDLVDRHRVSVLFGVPTFHAHLLGACRPERLSSLRAVVSAGEPLTVALATRVREFLGCPILDGLGSTEVGQTFVSNTLGAQRDGTIGRALPPYEVEVRDAGDALPGGDVGALWVRGPTVLLEYLGRPEATRAVKDGEWLRTGDRASIDPDGFVRHHGRIDDIELVGGINVVPTEIEALLATHEAVAEVAVAGVRDALGASRLEAFVVLSTVGGGATGLAAELTDLAARRLAPHKVPRCVHFVEELPRTATGKLRRFVLRSGALSGGG
jgi:fatty-acyl-CoA synthase/fatty acid CoA ligase FadD22